MRPRAKRAVKSRLRGRVEAGAFYDINGVYDNNLKRGNRHED